MLAALYGVTGGFHQLQKCLKIFRLLRKRRVNGHTQQIALAGFCIAAQPLVAALAVRLRILDYRQPVLHTYKIAEFPDSLGAAPKVAEFPCAVQCGGVPNDMVTPDIYSAWGYLLRVKN